MEISRFPRVRLAHLPTPLEPLERLTEHLSGPRIYIKRDDCTGLAIGGNKTRKLEFLMGEALAQGADTVITTGGVQSNHVRQTAAAAAKLGLDAEVVLTRIVPWNAPDYELTGNILLNRLVGAKVHLHSGDTDRSTAMAELAEGLRAQGKHPYLVPTGGSNAVGALGYASAALELVAQASTLGLTINYVIHACSSGGTLAGLAAGLAAMNHPAEVIGIDVDANTDAVKKAATDLAGEVADLLNIRGGLPKGAVTVQGGYAGEAYGLPTDEMKHAVELTARLEGVILDPVYSGKAMAGLFGLIEAGRFKPSDNVIFIHTGGTPALFAYQSVFGTE